MIRIGAILVGLFFAGIALYSFGKGAYTHVTEPGEKPAYYAFKKDAEGPAEAFSFEGPFGTWDTAQLQRGYQVYKEVCAACHSLQYVSFRNLAELGYNEAEVKQEASTYQIPVYDAATAEVETRDGLPTDKFPPVPYFGAGVPPDLSLITKARKNGVDYLYSLLTGYGEPDPELLAANPDFEVPAGLYFNPYFANVNISMAPPLVADGQITYNDGTEATISQMSQDVTAFLTWTAEPRLIKRKQTGVPVLAFLFLATILAFLSYKTIWASVKPRKD
ncbi:Cytochrome c1, heme protein, mitochondrial [Altererythrobacter insulae]|nr:Cytochrome c1, heme protein, mitochondrial [Altererythrobacter insulae]